MTGTWTMIAPPLGSHSGDHTATLLASGEVLVVGDGAETWDPRTGEWTAAGALAWRRNHTATRLVDGRVLVAGGSGRCEPGEVQLYDPASRTWTRAASMRAARVSHSATPLRDGRVLVVGGYDANEFGDATGWRLETLEDAELWDPATDAWSPVAGPAHPRHSHEAVLLADGRALIVGGARGRGTGIHHCEAWDPATGAWSPAGSLGEGRFDHAVAVLADERVVVAGGQSSYPDEPYDDVGITTAVDVRDPATGAWRHEPRLDEARQGCAAVSLGDVVLVSGGGSPKQTVSSIHASTELGPPWSAGPAMRRRRYRHAMVALADGRVLAVGGTEVAQTAEVWSR